MRRCAPACLSARRQFGMVVPRECAVQCGGALQPNKGVWGRSVRVGRRNHCRPQCPSASTRASPGVLIGTLPSILLSWWAFILHERLLPSLAAWPPIIFESSSSCVRRWPRPSAHALAMLHHTGVCSGPVGPLRPDLTVRELDPPVHLQFKYMAMGKHWDISTPCNPSSSG